MGSHIDLTPETVVDGDVQQALVHQLTTRGADGVSSMSINNLPITELPQEIGQFKNLTQLTIDGGNLESLPVELVSLKEIQWASFDNSKLAVLPHSVSALGKLESLSFTNNELTFLPGSILRLNPLSVEYEGNPWLTLEDVTRIIDPAAQPLSLQTVVESLPENSALARSFAVWSKESQLEGVCCDVCDQAVRPRDSQLNDSVVTFLPLNWDSGAMGADFVFVFRVCSEACHATAFRLGGDTSSFETFRKNRLHQST